MQQATCIKREKNVKHYSLSPTTPTGRLTGGRGRLPPCITSPSYIHAKYKGKRVKKKKENVNVK
jgi:hypothetical protein